jgi:hypothetical protein
MSEVNVTLSKEDFEKLAGDDLAAVMGTAIMNHLTPERREALIQASITSILTVRPDRYGSGEKPKSELEKLFENAVENIARQIVYDDISKDGRVRDLVKKLLDDVVNRTLDNESTREKLVDDVTRRFATFLKGERY